MAKDKTHDVWLPLKFFEAVSELGKWTHISIVKSKKKVVITIEKMINPHHSRKE